MTDRLTRLRGYNAMKLTLLIAGLFTGACSFAQTAIFSHEAIPVGGINQYVTIEGKDDSLPLLLFLHGGPGGSVMDYAGRFTDELQEHFVVVQWDQRETGQTFALNPSVAPLSLSLFQNDTHELIEILLKRFHRDKLYLAGHSWGTALGFYIAAKYPSLLYAYLPIGPMINQLESERMALALMKEKALKFANEKSLAELSSINIPFENGTQLYYHRKWLLEYAGSSKRLSKRYVDNWSDTWLSLFNEASEANLFEDLPKIDCPVYFFAGRYDVQTNSSITEQYYTHLVAPKKALFWFEHSAHGVPGSEPALLQKVIIETVLPETFTIQKPAAAVEQSVNE